MKKALGNSDSDDLNAAAGAAADAVMTNKQTLKEAAEDLVDKMNNKNKEPADKKPASTDEEEVQEIGKIKRDLAKDAILKEQANE